MKNTNREWLETDGLGGFASGTVCGRRSRRYHALLLTAAPEEGTRYVLVNGLEVHAQTSQGTAALSSQHYLPNTISPHGDRLIRDFQSEPWPTWEFTLPCGLRIRQEYFVPQGFAAVVLKWTLPEPASGPVHLTIRPLMSGRDYHALHQANDDFSFDHQGDGQRLQWTPYRGVPGTVAMSTGTYVKDPLWYRQFYYSLEAERGLDCSEDLASPGVFRFDLQRTPAVCVLTAAGEKMVNPPGLESSVEQLARELEQNERHRRSQFSSRLHRSADQFLSQTGARHTIIAGYPWFTDWGRDTFLSCRGLCLSTGQLDQAGAILRDWSRTVSEGMLPNRFPDGKTAPEYNSVDASLWFVIAVHDYLLAKSGAGQTVPRQDVRVLQKSIQEILLGYAEGTRFQIRADADGLLQAGEAGQQLTWMDAKVGDWVVTPRIGKPVEIQALWIHALWIGAQFDTRWQSLEALARKSFPDRFWNEAAGCLYDVVDVDHLPGATDGKIRPNQILAVGGLPQCLLEKSLAERVIKTVERQLVTPLGVRTLAPDDPDYHPHYLGDQRSRDGAYHQGTAWPWLMGPFVEGWLRVQGDSPENREEARRRFFQPLLQHLDEAGLGHLSEIADAEPTSTSAGVHQLPRGCPFQAWSLAELLRVLEQCGGCVSGSGP